MERRADRLFIWLPALCVGLVVGALCVDAVGEGFFPGLWFPLVIFCLILALDLASRRRGIAATPLDRRLAALAMLPAALVAVFDDRFLFGANVAAALVLSGIVAAAYGGKLTARRIARDPLGIGLGAWRNTFPRLDLGELVRQRAFGRLLAGAVTAVATVLAFFGIVRLALSPDLAWLGTALAVAAIAICAARLAGGWLALGSTPPAAPTPAAAPPARSSDIAPALPGRSRVGAVVTAVGMLGICLVCGLVSIGLGDFFVSLEPGSEYASVIGQLLAALAAIAGIAAIGFAGSVLPPQDPGSRERSMFGSPLAFAAVLVALAWVGAGFVLMLNHLAAASDSFVELPRVIAAVRMLIVLGAVGAALVWRCVTLGAAPDRFTVGLGVISGLFVVTANLARPDTVVPALFEPAALAAYPFNEDLSDDAVPWANALLSASDAGSAGGEVPLHERVLREIDARRSAWVDAAPRRRILGATLSTWRARRIVERLTDEWLEPTGVAVGSDGSIYVADDFADRVVRYDADGNVLGMLGQSGTGRGALREPSGIAVAADGTVYVADEGNRRVQRYDAAGTALEPWPLDVAAGAPSGIAVDRSGAVWVTDRGGDRVLRLGPSGATTRVLVGADGADIAANARVPRSALLPEDIAAGPDGTVYVVGSNRLQSIAPARAWRTAPGDVASIAYLGDIEFVSAVAVAADGRILVDSVSYDDHGDFVAAIDPKQGAIADRWAFPLAGYDHVDGIAIAADGTVYVADAARFTVWRGLPGAGALERWLPAASLEKAALAQTDPPSGAIAAPYPAPTPSRARATTP